MSTAAYTAQRDAFGRRVQWLVEIDLDRCDNIYTVAPCTATDAGDGSRCYYSFATCQDATNYTKTTRTYRFCLQHVPWSDTAYQVYPYLKQIVAVPQEIDTDKLFTYAEKLTLHMAADYNPPAPDTDKYSATAGNMWNTSTSGEFWRNLVARNRNWSGRAVRIKRGFYTSTFALTDFDQVGPAYRMKGIKFNGPEVRIECESPLAEINKSEIPWATSEDNTIQNAGGIDATGDLIEVKDSSEYPDPTDYTRNTIYVEIDDDNTPTNEICAVTALDATGDNILTVTRGALGTSAVAHTTSPSTVVVRHVAGFSGATGDDVNVMEVMQDILEWGGVLAADVNDTTFDLIKNGVWIDDDIKRIIRKPQDLAKLMQELRELRSVVVYIDSTAKWAASTAIAIGSTTTLNDDNFVNDSVQVDDDDESRLTRVHLAYSPLTDDARDLSDFSKQVIVIDTDLESANNFNDERAEVVKDLWISATTEASAVRNLARRIITRRKYGTRVITFALDVKDASLNVGDKRLLETRHITDRDGVIESRPILIVGKREVSESLVEYEAVDTNYSGRFLRMAPNTVTDNYDTATTEERSYGYWGDADNRVGTTKDMGYILV